MVLYDLQFQIFYADAGEIEVSVKQLHSENITERFMEENGINKKSGVECRTDLERTAQNVFAAVKGALDNFFLYFRLFSSYAAYKLINLW